MEHLGTKLNAQEAFIKDTTTKKKKKRYQKKQDNDSGHLWKSPYIGPFFHKNKTNPGNNNPNDYKETSE